MKYKLICFDVDGTLIDNIEYSWQLFHDYFKTDQQIRAKAKEAFFKKKITYKEWAEHDIQMWVKKNAQKNDFIDAIRNSNIKLMKGAMETITALKNEGLKLAIISGSINIMLHVLLPDYENMFDYIFLSKIHFDQTGKISKIDATEYDMDGKALALKEIVKRENIKLKECVFIGDHNNDLKIAQEAGLSIAFDAKDEELKIVSDIVIDSKDLREVLYYIL